MDVTMITSQLSAADKYALQEAIAEWAESCTDEPLADFLAGTTLAEHYPVPVLLQARMDGINQGINEIIGKEKLLKKLIVSGAFSQ